MCRCITFQVSVYLRWEQANVITCPQKTSFLIISHQLAADEKENGTSTLKNIIHKEIINL